MPDPRDHDEQPELSAEERAWRDIVDNFGDRAELDEPERPEPESPELQSPGPVADAPFAGRFGDPRAFVVPDDDDPVDADGDLRDEEEGYVPPPPPPLPTVSPDRGLAWAGVFGSPLVLLVALIAGISLPSLLGYALIAAFVGGFVYLVVTMPREPRDPFDDGAQV